MIDLSLDLNMTTICLVLITDMHRDKTFDYSLSDATCIYFTSEHLDWEISSVNDVLAHTFRSARMSSFHSTQASNIATAGSNDMSNEETTRTSTIHTLIDSTMQQTFAFNIESDCSSVESALHNSWTELLRNSVSTRLTETLRPSTGFTIASSMFEATDDMNVSDNVLSTSGNSHLLTVVLVFLTT